MELHRNIPCCIFFSEECEDVPLETAAFVECKRAAFHASGKDILGFFIGGRGVNAALQAVIRKQAAAFPDKEIQAGTECFFQIRQTADGIAPGLSQRVQVLRIILFPYQIGLVGTEGRQYLYGKIFFPEQTMVMQILTRIIGGAQYLDILLFQQVPDRKVRRGQFGVAGIPDFFVSFSRKRGGDVKVPLQLQVGPVV